MRGSAEWQRAVWILDYCGEVLRQSQQIWAENDRFWAERNPASGEVLVGRKADQQVVAQGSPGESGWEVTQANVSQEDWQEFRARFDRLQQQRERERLAAEQQRENQKRRSRGFGIG